MIGTLEVLRAWFGADRYARDYEYLHAQYEKNAQLVVDLFPDVAAEVAKARAKDAAKIDKATSTLKAVEWHLRQKDHSGHIHGVVVAALAQIGAKP